MPIRPIVSPEDQNVTFVELFFDLVFVFSVTQVVGLLHHDLSWTGVGQSLLVFWLVWWAWTQFTWTLNATDTTHHVIDLATLAATIVVFFMAVALPHAFSIATLWFAVPYVLVRGIGIGLQLWAARESPDQWAAARTFATLSLGGLVAVLAGGLLGGSLLYVFWGLAIVLDLVAAAIAGRRIGWNIHPAHFAERHGLFVILALGETLIAAGSVATTATEAAWTNELIAITILAVAFTCGLWWTYFFRGHPALEHALTTRREAQRSELARDVFSLLHFPMICGVIAYAVAVEEAIAHPSEPLTLAARLALAAGLFLFVGGMAAAVWRAKGLILWKRLGLAAGTAGAIVLVGAPPLYTLALALLGVVLTAASEWGMDHGEATADPTTAGA